MLFSVFYHGLLSAALLLSGSSAYCTTKPPHKALVAPSAPCRESLLLACRQMGGLPENKEAVAHLQFTSRTFFRVPDQKQVREVATPTTLYAQGSKLFFQTPQVSLWQDGKYVATAMHAQRLIYLTRIPPKQAAQQALTQFSLLRDSLILRGRLSQCQPAKLGSKQYQRMVLEPSPADQAHYHVTSLGFLLDGSRIKELTVQYPRSAQAVRVVYSIEKQEFIASSSKLPASARMMVVDKDNHPLKAYSGYRVVDHTELTHLPY